MGAGIHKPERATLKLDLYATAFLLSGLFLDILEHFFPRKWNLHMVDQRIPRSIIYQKGKLSVFKSSKISFLGL